MTSEIQLIIAILGVAVSVIGAVFGSYLGVKIAVTKLQVDVSNLSAEIKRLDSYILRMEEQLEKRITTIEQRCFQAFAGNHPQSKD